MSGPPDYFDEIREAARQRWRQLEADPELAGPWHQLFRQVQSPRHVLSELLQNADDAGATEASVRIVGGRFIFEHNGEDFTREHFASLCRFGYSNKRVLHTIGFRGIGFKSTFSLGDTVELYTPTLSVCFHRQRFTEPCWREDRPPLIDRTRVAVTLADAQREAELKKNLLEWRQSPVSLLFFRHLRRLEILGKDMHWQRVGDGPVPGSDAMVLNGQQERSFLLLRSPPEDLPEAAIAEARSERLLFGDEQFELPPVQVELVLGAPGRLYVVLPTGVETRLPFAINAPFIQDPARLKIKDPETSPTNQWLLAAAGRFVGRTVLQWLGDQGLSREDRARAYNLLPAASRSEATLAGGCERLTREACERVLEDAPCVLTEAGELVAAGGALLAPLELNRVWTDAEISACFDAEQRPLLSWDVSAPNRQKLTGWGLVKKLELDTVVATLQDKRPPRPAAWHRLLALWAFIAPKVTGYWRAAPVELLNIFPVHGAPLLHAAGDIVRLDGRQLLESADDWDFLSRQLRVLDHGWVEFLEAKRAEADEADADVQRPVEAAVEIMVRCRLQSPATANVVIQRVAERLSADAADDWIRLAQIAANLDANVDTKVFRYVTRSGVCRLASEQVLADEDGGLEALLPPASCERHLLHPAYLAEFRSCSREQWWQWIRSGRAGIGAFPRPGRVRRRVSGRQRIQQLAAERGYERELDFPYVTSSFVVVDRDFDASLWSHWEALAADDEQLWVRIGERILTAYRIDSAWKPVQDVRIIQVATTGTEKNITQARLLPRWLLRLRELPCLPDTRGRPCKPAELLRRTPETEPLLDVEPFVHARLDTEATRELLDLLGVRSEPAGPVKLLERLRALAGADRPPLAEVEKWYRRLDDLFERAGTADQAAVRDAFQQEPLILAEDGSWCRAKGIFLAADEDDVPGAPLVRAEVRDLALWPRVGVAERATAELALAWLRTLPAGEPLPEDQRRRVRALCARHPLRVWQDCGHWLNLAGQWRPTGELRYALGDDSAQRYRHLHPWVLEATADLRQLPEDRRGRPPFSALASLSASLEERLETGPVSTARSRSPDWLAAVAQALQRVALDDEQETGRIRGLAARLAGTRWVPVDELRLIPYVDGKPAGTPRAVEAAWIGKHLYVARLPAARLARCVPEELGRQFARKDVLAALHYCCERSAPEVEAYLEQNFPLSEVEPVPVPGNEKGQAPRPPGGDAPAPPPAGPAAGGEPGPMPANTGGEEPPPGPVPVPEPAGPGAGHPPRRPPSPGVIERFAAARGFQRAESGDYWHADGSRLLRRRDRDALFPWELRRADGQLVAAYLPIEKTLHDGPTEIAAEQWAAFEKAPERYALLLPSSDSHVEILHGRNLLMMRQRGTIVLYPAAYRLVCREESDVT